MFESLWWKYHVRDGDGIDKSMWIVLIWNVRVEEGSHRDVVTWRRIVLALENWMTAGLSGVRCQGPPITRPAGMLD